MLCPRCSRETDDRAAFCDECGAPLTLREEPLPRRLDVTLDLDRRRSRTPPPAAAAPLVGAHEPVPALAAEPDADPDFAPAQPASRSHWDLGRMLEEVAREEGFFSAEPPPPVQAAPPPMPPPRAARAATPVAAASHAAAFAATAVAASRAPALAEPSPDAFAWATPAPRAPAVSAGRSEVHLRRPATWRRAAAWAIDAGPLLAGVVYLGSALLASATGGLAPVAGLDDLLDLVARESGIVLSLAALLAVSLAVYATLAHALAGATLGKWMLGLRVVGPDGERPSLARSAVRAALAGVSIGLVGLGFLLALFTRSGRALHDLLARTWVVEAP